MSYSLIPTPINHQVYLIFEISGKMTVNVFLLEPQILEARVCPISTYIFFKFNHFIKVAE